MCPVRALCLGQVGAGAIGVVAVCTQRAALPSTRFSLCEPTTRLEAHVRNVAQWAELRAGERRRFCERVAAAVGQAGRHGRGGRRERGRFLSAAEAVEYGILDEVSRPDAAIRRLPGSGPGAAAHRVPAAALTAHRARRQTPCFAACSCPVYVAFRNYASFGRLHIHLPTLTTRRVPPGKDLAQPACLRCGHGRTRTSHGTAPRRRVGRAPHPAARAFPRRDGRADAHLHDPGPRRPRAVPSLARLRRGAPLRARCRAGCASW